MKLIGLIGGMSGESSRLYQKILDEQVKMRLGGLNSSKKVIYDVNFAPIEKLQAQGKWDIAAEELTDIALQLQSIGADFIVICTNTMHIVVKQISYAIDIPILHIADVTGDEILKAGIKKVGLLGTRFTMEMDFYKEKIIEKSIDVIIPQIEDREIVNNIIYNELCNGIIKKESKQKYIRIVNEMINRGAEGIILGCTEICTLINQDDFDIPVFDTTFLHAKEAARLQLE